MAYPSFPTCPPLPPLNSIIVCKYKYIAWKEEEGSHKGKRKSRKESIKRKDEGNKNEWGWSKKRKEIVSYFFKVIFYGKVWKWINIVKYKEKGRRKKNEWGWLKRERKLYPTFFKLFFMEKCESESILYASYYPSLLTMIIFQTKVTTSFLWATQLWNYIL